MEAMDTDDEIIEEIPIYLSKNLVENLYIFQYPSKKFDCNLDTAEVVKSHIKPLSEHVKFDIALNSASKHYDAFKGEQFALAADGQKSAKTDSVMFRSGTMDRQSFTSTNPMENTDKYIIGIYQDHEIHASSIKGFLQMRPAFHYFDKSDKRTKEEKRAEANADLDDDEPTQVTVSFASSEDEVHRKAREKSYKFVTKKSLEEPWCETMWYPKDSKEAEAERRKFFVNANTGQSNTFDLSCDNYIKTLITPPMEGEEITENIQNKVITKSILSTLSLADQVRAILIDARVIQFNKLLELLSLTATVADKVLRVLPSVGMLIKGNWVVLSEILYPENYISQTNGVSAELMCRARDYILYLLSKNAYIDRRRVAKTAQIPPEEIKEILDSVAYWNNLVKNWSLLLPADRAFEEKYQELKERQDVYWRAKEAKFQEMEETKRTRKKSIREGNKVESTAKS